MRREMNGNLMATLLIFLMVIYIYEKETDTTENLSSAPAVSEFEGITPNLKDKSELKRSLPAPVKVPDNGRNLLRNSAFDSSLDQWSYETGVFWSENGGTSESGALLINAPQIESKSRRIYSKSIDQCVRLGNGTMFSAEANFRYLDNLPQRPSVNRIHIYWYESLDCKKGGQYGSYLEPKLEENTWQKVSRNKLKPSLGAKAAKIIIEQRQDGNNNAEAIWDNISFFITSSKKTDARSKASVTEDTKPFGENYVLNSSFDVDLQYWWPNPSKRLQWRSLDGTERRGVMAAKLTNKRQVSLGTGSFSQCVNIGTHKRFKLGALVKVADESTQRGGGRLRPTWHEYRDCEGRSTTSGRHADIEKDEEGWQTLYVDQLIPKFDAKSVRISMIHSIDGSGEHLLLWDDVYFNAY